MKNLLNRKYLLLSISICLLLAIASLFFIPVKGYQWSIPVILFIASFIVSFFIVSLSKTGDKKRVAVIRYIIAALVVLSVLLYLNLSKTIIGKVTYTQLKDEQLYTSQKNIITGRELLDKSDPEVNRINNSNHRDSIYNMINENDPEKIWTAASISTSKIKLFSAFILLFVLLTVLLVYLATEILLGNKNNIEIENKVFISYNHQDQAIARALCTALLGAHIDLIVDSKDTASGSKVENMITGTDIYTFIHNSIKKSKVTLMIVSKNSLQSTWVANEASSTFFLESFFDDRSFLACNADDIFNDPGFLDNAYTQIDKKLKDIDEDIKERMNKQINTRDLNDQKTRLLDLRGGLDKTFERLQTSLCADISGGNLQHNIDDIVKAIRLRFDD